MNTPVETDIIGMLRHLVCALQVFAKGHDVEITFQSGHQKLIISYDPVEIISPIIRLVCQIVEYSPTNQSILLKAALVQERERKVFKIVLQNTGINLSRIGEITHHIKNCVIVQNDIMGGTIYELQWQLEQSLPSANEVNSNIHCVFPQVLPSFYTKVRRHLQSHFTKADNLIALLSSRNPKDAAFLKKVNILILSNIDKDGFNANHLSTAMGMSRTQLYRRLQPIIRQAPGCYIKTMRIQKAKELLETTDMRVGEVAFKTGFQTPSHFTRVFSQHYGVNPSLFSRKTKM